MPQVSLPNGATFAIAAAMAAAVTVTGISNASPAVASAAGHALADGDILALSSGWSQLDNRIARVDAADAGTFALEGFDTTRTTRFPAGEGAGSVRKVNGWQQIAGVLQSQAQGGEQQFYTYSFLEDTGDEKQIPTTRTPQSITLTIADDETQPYFAALRKADEEKTALPVRMLLTNGDAIYFMAYASLSEMPTATKNEAMARTVTLSLIGKTTRYKAAA